MSIQPSDLDSVMKRSGFANWEAFQESSVSLSTVLDRVKVWRKMLDGKEKLWLCWNVNSDWCYVQQRLVQDVGWTPVIGYDPRVGPPTRLVDNAILIDFNEGLGFPTLHPVFPLEFVWLFAERLAFWHSDLLVRPEKMHVLANWFDELPQGTTMAVNPKFELKKVFSKYNKRYWELIGCTTAQASLNQFETGAGWWRHIENHPNCPDFEIYERKKLFWDHGVGIRYWEKNKKGKVKLIPESYVFEGHCTQINNPKYVRVSPNNQNKNLSLDLVANFRLEDVCARLGIDIK